MFTNYCTINVYLIASYLPTCVHVLYVYHIVEYTNIHIRIRTYVSHIQEPMKEDIPRESNPDTVSTTIHTSLLIAICTNACTCNIHVYKRCLDVYLHI